MVSGSSRIDSAMLILLVVVMMIMVVVTVWMDIVAVSGNNSIEQGRHINDGAMHAMVGTSPQTYIDADFGGVA